MVAWGGRTRILECRIGEVGLAFGLLTGPVAPVPPPTPPKPSPPPRRRSRTRDDGVPGRLGSRGAPRRGPRGCGVRPVPRSGDLGGAHGDDPSGEPRPPGGGAG